jgi:protein TonB
MKAVACLAILSMILHPGLLAQKDVCCVTGTEPDRVRVSAELAQKMLIHKAALACPHVAMAAWVIGTVVVSFEIDKNGNVVRPRIVSGPRMLQKPVLNAVLNYKYKPYLLNGKPVEAQTSGSVHVDTVRDCPSN